MWLMMDDLYREEILDHYRSSRHRGPLPDADTTFEDDNPLCGDRIRMDVRLAKDGSIEEVRFSGEGCAISQATASMLCEEVVGKATGDVTGWDKQKVLDLLGISLTPLRLKCALLPLKVLQAALWKSVERSAPRPQPLPTLERKP
jgi:nitrogen fixation protein NifU and related proteins